MKNEMQRIEDLSVEILGEEKVDKQVEKVVCFLLEKDGHTSVEKSIYTKDIQEKYANLKNKYPAIVELNPSSISTYLSILSRDSSSPINCQGKKKGYYVSLPVNDSTANNSNQDASIGCGLFIESATNKQLEKNLYPMMLSWLASKVDRVKDVSNLRGNTKWRNPDILGVKFKNLLGREHIELVTIEVKPFMKGWQQFIFEAISHYMFVNRSYFAFLHPVEEKIPDIMKLYANQFGIGLISIEFTKEDWDKFNQSGEIPDAEDFDIIEIAPSVYHVPNIDLESEFLEGLSVKNFTELHEYGDSSKNI